MILPKPGAVLISMDDDILPFNVLPSSTSTSEVTEAIPPTRTSINSELMIRDGLCVIGRDHACDVRVREQRIDISRRHATIKFETDHYIILDHSKHGTFVNGTLVKRACRLETDDIIGLANSRQMLRFVDYAYLEAARVKLTERERDVLTLLVAGRAIKEIADDLIISPDTVSTHLKSIYKKLEVGSRAEAVAEALKRRLVSHP